MNIPSCCQVLRLVIMCLYRTKLAQDPRGGRKLVLWWGKLTIDNISFVWMAQEGAHIETDGSSGAFSQYVQTSPFTSFKNPPPVAITPSSHAPCAAAQPPSQHTPATQALTPKHIPSDIAAPALPTPLRAANSAASTVPHRQLHFENASPPLIAYPTVIQPTLPSVKPPVDSPSGSMHLALTIFM